MALHNPVHRPPPVPHLRQLAVVYQKTGEERRKEDIIEDFLYTKLTEAKAEYDAVKDSDDLSLKFMKTTILAARLYVWSDFEDLGRRYSIV